MLPTSKFDVHFDRSSPLRSHATTFASLTHGTLTEGNLVEVLQNGHLFDSMMAELRKAESTIHLENYLWKPGKVLESLVGTLAERSRSGVEVRVVYDWLGTREVQSRPFDLLREAGCRVVRHRHVPLVELVRINRRDHRKILVIDASTAYVFGHAISDEWVSKEPETGQWRDTGLRLQGPVVTQLQTVFAENWNELTGEAFAGERYFPEQPEIGQAATHVAYINPSRWKSAVHRLYYLAIQAASHSILVQNPYFVPDAQAVRYLREALRRGVSIRIMLPTAGEIDFPIVQHASHHFFARLLDAGAEIYEYERSALHQKVFVVDDEWCCVGSTNFDSRSFHYNDEVSVGIFDPAVARALATAFDEDVSHSVRWTAAEWRARPWKHRLLDFTAALGRRQL
jgi:cardiolipin synthase A/B